MTTVGSSWVEIEWWGDTSYGDYQARWRVLARSTQNITNNTSAIYFKLQKRVTGGSAYNYDSLDFTIEGTGAKSDSHSAHQSWSFGSVSSTDWTDVGGDTDDMYWSNVKHNDDGTLTLTANAFGDRWNGGTFDTDISITLPTIARASVPSVTPNPITLSNSTNTITVNTNRKSSSFVHSVTVTIGSFTQNKQNITTSTTFDIPQSVLADFAANSKTLSGTVACTTFNGSTNIGTKWATFSAQIDTSQEHPNIGTVTITDTNAYTSAIEASGSYIRKASDLVVTIPLTASGSYTELASASVACGNVTQNYVLSGTSQTITFEYDKIDTNGLTITVTDKRGTTATTTKSWNLVPYIDLTVSGAVRRTTETGNTISFKLSGQCFAGSFGSATNEITVSYKYKLHSASAYTDGSSWTFTPSGDGETTYEYTNTTSGFDYDQQYDIIFTVQDLFTSASTEALIITKGIPVYGNGEDFVAIYGDLHIHDKDDPNLFWTLTQANDLAQGITDLQNQLAFSNESATGTFTNSNATKTYKVEGKGVVICNVWARSSNANDTGSIEAWVRLLNQSNATVANLAYSGNRLTAASTFQNGANASTAYYFDGVSTNNRLQFYVSCSKSNTTNWRLQITAIGCTVTAI